MADDDKWYTSLGEDAAGNKMVNEAPDLATFVKSALDNQAFLGSSIRIPGEDASADAVKEFNQKLMDKVPGLYQMPGEDDAEGTAALFTKLGKPAEAKDYGLTEAEGLTPEQLQALQATGHKLNLTKAQMQGMVEQLVTDNKAQAEALTGELQQTHQALKDKWGLAYKDRMGQALAVAKQFFPFIGDDLTKANANIVEAFADLGKSLGTEGLEFGSQDNQGGEGSMVPPAEAMAQVHEIMGNQQHAYWVASDPGHAAAVTKVTKLMAMANPKASLQMERAGSSLADMQKVG